MSVYVLEGDNRLSRSRTGPFRWKVDLPRIPETTSGDYTIEVRSFIIENFFPVVIQGLSDTLLYTFDGTDGFFTFSEGNYDIYSLIDSVQTALQTLNAGFALEFDEMQFKTSLFTPAGHTFTLRRTASDDDYNYENDAVDRFLELLGWSFTSSFLSFSGGNTGYTWTPNNGVRCVGPKWVDLCATLPVRNVYMQGKGRHPAICHCPLAEGSYGSTIVYQPYQPTPHIVNLLGFNSFDLYIVDDHGTALSGGFPSMENVIISYLIILKPYVET